MINNNSKIEKYRITTGMCSSTERFGSNGAFIIPYKSFELFVIASDGLGWDHVSVSLRNRPPNWEEMCFIKNMFFDEEETVIQYHPKKSEYVNNHQNCLHLWKNQSIENELPPIGLIGVKL